MSPSPTDYENILELLERTVSKLKIQIRYDSFEKITPHDGGICKVGDDEILIVDQSAPIENKCHLIATTLKNKNLDQIYIPPLLREFINK